MKTYIVGVLSKDYLSQVKEYGKENKNEKIILAFETLENTEPKLQNVSVLFKIIQLISKCLAKFSGFCLIDEIVQNEDNKVVVASHNGPYLEIRNHLSALAISEAFLPREDNKIWTKENVSLPELEYIEYHISWHCNLKCKGCGHLSNLCDEELFGDLEKYIKDLSRLHQLVDNISVIRLMGGNHY